MKLKEEGGFDEKENAPNSLLLEVSQSLFNAIGWFRLPLCRVDLEEEDLELEFPPEE
jgi:hypothetical protein